jgi:hypothetical protein
MNTAIIEQTVEIPANHRLFLKLDLPATLPDGLAGITLKIRPRTARDGKTVLPVRIYNRSKYVTIKI